MPEVMGQAHRFAFEAAEVVIQLPSADKADRDPRYDEIASVGARWKADDTPVDYVIFKVDVTVNLGRAINLPPAVLTQNANAYDVIPADQQEALNRLVNEHSSLAERAFEYWLSVIRWVTNDYRIGRKTYSDYRSGGWGTRLEEAESRKTIWIEGGVVKVPGYHRITIDEWKTTQERLTGLQKTPMHIALKQDAEEFAEMGDYRRALIDLCVSCETFLRSTVLAILPPAVAPTVLKYIEDANIHQYVAHFFPSILEESTQERYRKGIRSELDSLFAKRNDIMHRGDSAGATDANCRRFTGVLEELFTLMP